MIDDYRFEIFDLAPIHAVGSEIKMTPLKRKL